MYLTLRLQCVRADLKRYIHIIWAVLGGSVEVWSTEIFDSSLRSDLESSVVCTLLTPSSPQLKKIFCVISGACSVPCFSCFTLLVCLATQYLLTFFYIFLQVLRKFSCLYTNLWQYEVTVVEHTPFPLKISLQLSSINYLNICNFFTCELLSILDSYKFNCFNLLTSGCEIWRFK